MRTSILITVSAVLFAVSLLVVTGRPVQAEQQTWSGQISDSRCGAVHEEDADAAGGGPQGAPTPRECTLACIRGGSKYVFVMDDKVFQISDQKNPALETFAGDTVKLTGELTGTVITVSKIEMP